MRRVPNVGKLLTFVFLAWGFVPSVTSAQQPPTPPSAFRPVEWGGVVMQGIIDPAPAARRQPATVRLPVAQPGPFAAQTGAFRSDATASDSSTATTSAPNSVSVGDSCQSGVDCQPCCPVCWHRTGAFGEFLFLQAREVDLVYARPQDGVDLFTSVPVGDVGVADPDYQPGVRAGFAYALSRCASVAAAYSHFESQTSDTISTTAPNVIRSFLHHPSTITSQQHIGLSATANYDLDFQLADLEYRRLLVGSKCGQLNYSLGARYGHLDQDLNMNIARVAGDSTVSTAIDFDGAGVRLGLDAERSAPRSGLFAYGKAYASAMAGHFTSSYLLTNAFAGTLAATGWDDDRVVPVFEYEVGAGWQSASGRWRLSAGYTMAAWSNVITTAEWIGTVQNNDFADVHDTIVFEGLTSRVEFRW